MPNNSFKPNLLRYTKAMAERACHGFGSTTQVGLTQALLGITKYSIVTNSNDSVTLRLMTEHDLAMLYEWLNRSHIVEWW
ncbi:hypothetical protein RCE58_27500, partial [Klebsiella pneumoniae]|nr:hypothetical protein [Klebsiella pneumoniae]